MDPPIDDETARLNPARHKFRRAASDGAQAMVWLWFFLMLAALLVLGVAWSLSHRVSLRAPHVEPEPPTLPGQLPEPRKR